ncbi:MAG: polyprenyl synthetase family protein, partial [Draconibacterium sp.]|nr:polyprenyl synthetase family protein [Draconibacterium sp.]
KRMKDITVKKPVELFKPIDYTLQMGGKRLRPVLLLMSYNLFRDDILNAVPAALAIEIFHNFTLLHDDIMDNAEMRRNRPTVHKKYSENTAILSGDAMAFLSYKYLLESKSNRLVDVIELFSNTAIEVCEGQQYDMDFENRLDVTEEEYLEMIRLKTAVLIACSLQAGALLADADDGVTKQLYDFGLNLGLAFQLQDDLLDTFGDEKTFGKRIGGDILANKKTYLLINALEKSETKHKKELLDWINRNDFNPEEKIQAVKDIYVKSDIKNLTTKKIDQYFSNASVILDEIPLSDVVKQELHNISRKMLKRNH